MSSRIHDVVIVCRQEPAPADRNAQKIARFLGVEATFVALSPAALRDGASIRSLVPRCTCLIVAAETLAEAADAMRTGATGLSDLTDVVAEHVFIYGFLPTERHAAMLRVLSSGALIGIYPQADPAARFHVSSRFRKWCGQFTGLSFDGVDPAREHRFLEGPEERRSDPLIHVGDGPLFVRLERSGVHLFFLACAELADLDEPVRRHARPLPWFSRLVPLMMFLRGALGDRVWHSDTPRACLIIDDPLLKNRYGFLDYRRLLDVMQRRRFATSIAFIPLNYRRSRSDVAALLTSNQDAASLCVHGCDHTDGEFATTHFGSLHAKAQTALERMRAHYRLSGVAFDDVMVFPQGRFSAEAVAALKASGYLAAVNGDVGPANAPPLTLRNWLEVAVTRFADFPLFGRRYPAHIAEFAFDLFMGKPALAVEHHRYFENGYGEVESFVERLNGLDDRLEWANLATICSRACLTRTSSEGEHVLVRFYTSRFTLQNRGTQARTYFLFKRQPPDGHPVSVTIDGNESDYERNSDELVIPLALDAGRIAQITVSSRGSDARPPWRSTNMHGAKVRARRLLGEFRDDYVDTTRVFLSRLIGRALGRRSRKGATTRPQETGDKSYLSTSSSVER
jgi:hypothetical protein